LVYSIIYRKFVTEINIGDYVMRNFIASLQANHLFRGIASLGNIYGASVRGRYKNVDNQAVLRRDWELIGEDMRKALAIYRKEVNYAK